VKKRFGCRIYALTTGQCLELVHNAVEGGHNSSHQWLLAHCFDGVVWGRADGNRWKVSSTVFPDISPPIGEWNLMELRIFCKQSECFVWRAGDGFRGRRLEHDQSGLEEVTAPAYEERILLGNRIVQPSLGGFTVVGDATGSRHAVPLECSDQDFVDAKDRGISPLRLGVWNYFEQEQQEAPESDDRPLATGAVRIAISRLTHVWKEPRNV